MYREKGNKILKEEISTGKTAQGLHVPNLVALQRSSNCWKREKENVLKLKMQFRLER